MVSEKLSKKKLKEILNRRNFVIVVLVFFFVSIYMQLNKLVEQFVYLYERDSSLVAEIGQLKDTYLDFGEDLNEIREYLRMPTEQYLMFDSTEDENTEVDVNEDDIQLALFKYVDYLNKSQNVEEKLEFNKSLIYGLEGSNNFSDFLDEESLSFDGILESDDGYLITISHEEIENIFTFYLDKEDGKLYFKTAKVKEEVQSENYENFETETKNFILENKSVLLEYEKKLDEINTEIASTLDSDEVATVSETLEITIDPEYTEKDLKITYSVYNKSEELIGQIILDTEKLEIHLADTNDDSLSLQVTDITSSLVPFLEMLDTKTFIEKKVDEALNNLINSIDDDGFKLMLSENDLSMAEVYREDESRVYFDIFDKDGLHLSSIVLEKSTGVVNIVNPDGTNSENLLFFDPEYKKKTLELPDEIPEYGDDLSSSDNTFNILIAGKHGSLIDTMIFAHINEDTRKVRMISIPRDLHYQGRKINSYAFYYGLPELKKVLSKISGYELDKYILIDMYAFIDVIDLIGGIDINLEHAVIDPTYRTVDNGIASTLHYEPGDYHLSGVQALRLARTRHTSSDFARAERQQMIIESIQDKARNFGFGDADTIYEISKSVLAQTETDISVDEAIQYFFRYQNYDIESNDVMSSGNVLYVPPYTSPSTCKELSAAAEAAGEASPSCENENQAYTLLPKNNNWNVIKWYFKDKFESI